MKRDSYVHHMQTLLLALFLVAFIGNLIPRDPAAQPSVVEVTDR